MSESKYHRHSETWIVRKPLFLPRLNNGGLQCQRRKDATNHPPTPTGRSRKPATAGMLERLDADELAAVLRSLLRKHPELKRDAESVATAIVSSPSVEDIADEVCTNLTSLDVDELK